jgi:hypothetical protein
VGKPGPQALLDSYEKAARVAAVGIARYVHGERLHARNDGGQHGRILQQTLVAGPRGQRHQHPVERHIPIV